MGGFADFIAQMMARNASQPMSEQPPAGVNIPGMGGGMPSAIPGVPSSGMPLERAPGMTQMPARVGGPPPQIATPPPGIGLPGGGIPGLPGPTGTDRPPYQPFPPVKSPGMVPAGQTFPTKGAAMGASVNNAIQGITSGVMAFKQKQAQNQTQQARAVTAKIIQQQQAIDQEQNPETKKMLQEQLEQMKNDPKIHKILDKASTDPNSPFYAGVQMAYQDATARAMQQQQLEAAQALAEERRAQAQRAIAAAQEQQARAQLEKRKAEHPEEFRSSPNSKPILRPHGVDPVTKAPIYGLYDPATNTWLKTKDETGGVATQAIGSTTGTARGMNEKGEPTTTTIRQKTFPSTGGANKIAPGTKPSQPGGPGTGFSSSNAKADSVRNQRVLAAAEQLHFFGKEDKDPYIRGQAAAWLQAHNLSEGHKISPEAQRAAAVSKRLVSPEWKDSKGNEVGLIEALKDQINSLPEDKKKKLGTIWSNFDFYSNQVKGTTGDEQFDQILARFGSIYAVGANMHGWRGYKAPDGLAKSFGDIRRSADNIIDSMNDLENLANLNVRIGTYSENISKEEAEKYRPGIFRDSNKTKSLPSGGPTASDLKPSHVNTKTGALPPP